MDSKNRQKTKKIGGVVWSRAYPSWNWVTRVGLVVGNCSMISGARSAEKCKPSTFVTIFFVYQWLKGIMLGITLPEPNSSPLKTGLPKRKVVFQPTILRGYVGCREGKSKNGSCNKRDGNFWSPVACVCCFLWFFVLPTMGFITIKTHHW